MRSVRSYAENKGLLVVLCINEYLDGLLRNACKLVFAAQNRAIRADQSQILGVVDDKLGLQIVQKSPPEFGRLPAPLRAALDHSFFARLGHTGYCPCRRGSNSGGSQRFEKCSSFHGKSSFAIFKLFYFVTLSEKNIIFECQKSKITPES